MIYALIVTGIILESIVISIYIGEKDEIRTRGRFLDWGAVLYMGVYRKIVTSSELLNFLWRLQRDRGRIQRDSIVL
jgi:hypothetical protein